MAKILFPLPDRDFDTTEVAVSPGAFERGPRELSKRGTRDDDTHAFVVEDGNYVSARWPGDAI